MGSEAGGAQSLDEQHLLELKKNSEADKGTFADEVDSNAAQNTAQMLGNQVNNAKQQVISKENKK